MKQIWNAVGVGGIVLAAIVGCQTGPVGGCPNGQCHLKQGQLTQRADPYRVNVAPPAAEPSYAVPTPSPTGSGTR